MKKVILPFLLFIALVFPTSAQTGLPVQGGTSTLLDRLKEIRAGYQMEVQGIRVQDHEQMQALREKFKSEMQTLRTQVQNKLQTEREALKAKLQSIRNEQKQKTVSRVADSLNDLNQRLTKQYGDMLDKLDQVLSRISSRADKAQARSLDVSAVLTQIQSARTAIGTGRDTVKAQAAKTYTINLPDIISTSTMSAVKSAMQSVRDALKNDLTAVRDVVKAARDAVQKAATTLAQIPRVNEATSTTTSTNQ